MAEVKVNDHVTHRKPIRGNQNLIKMGKVMSIDGQSAVVKFDKDPVARTVPLKSLEPVSSRFAGRASVNPNPALRNQRG